MKLRKDTFINSLRSKKDTNIYKLQDTKKFEDAVKNINWETEVIDPSTFEDELKIINRRFNYNLKLQVISAYQNGQIVTIYPYENNLTKLIPIFLIINNNTKEINAIINLRLYTSKDKNDNYNVDIKRLYAFLEEAYIDLMLQKSPNIFLFSSKIMSLSTKIYVKLMNKVFDKLYGINLQPEWSDRLNYLLGKFFLKYVIEKPDSDTVDDMAAKTIFNDTTKEALKSFEAQMDPVMYNDIQDFFKALAEHFPILSKVTLRVFMENFMIMYGEAAVYSMELYSSLLETVFSAAIFDIKILKDFMIDSVVGKETALLHSEISRLLTTN